MTGVEGWFHAFDGLPEHAGYWTPDAPNASFEMLDPTVADADLAAYQASVERAERAVAALDLDALRPCSECADEPRSLRWVYTHMLEEYARHNGHADLIREAIDGAVGD